MVKKPQFYAVARGHKTGIYLTWDDCQNQVSGYSNASFKKFSTRKEALDFVNGALGSLRKQSVLANDKILSRVNGSKAYSVAKPASNGGSVASKALRKSKHQSIYIDGASRGNGKLKTPNSGFGVYFGEGDPRNVGIGLHEVDNINKVKPTNQRAELHALKYALEHAVENESEDGYEIFTDSMYSKNCIEKWSDSWERNGWKSSTGKEVANQDLIKPSLRMYRRLKNHYGNNLNITHVRGHQGNVGNEAADKLANDGADEMARRS